MSYLVSSKAGEWGSMQAVILAAGGGSRLNGLSDFVHKSQVSFGGRSLLQYQLDVLERMGIHDVCVVTGYNSDAVRANAGNRASFIHNERWAVTNSLYSLSLCRWWVKHPLVVMNCDVLMHPEVVAKVIATAREYGNGFAYDSDSGTHDEHMKVVLDGDRLVAMRKGLGPDMSDGENVGVLAFSHEAAMTLFDESEAIFQLQGEGVWMATAVERMAQYQPLHGVDISGLPWVEIDYPEDYTEAVTEVWPNVRRALSQDARFPVRIPEMSVG